MSFLIENKIKTFQYLFIWLLYTFIQALSLFWISELPFWVLLADAFTHAVLFAFFGIVIWNIMFFGNYEKMPALHRMVNYSALGVLILLIWVGGGYGLDYIYFGKETAFLFLPLLPVYSFIGILLYLILIFYIRAKVNTAEQEEEVRKDIIVKQKEEEIKQEEISERNIEETEEHETLERIAVKSGHKIHVILVPDIFYLQADGDYVHIFTESGKYMKEQTMKYFEENLPTTQFARVHRSYIVNLESISRIEQYQKQNQLLTLKNGHHIKVSLSGYKLLKTKLGL